MPLDTTFVSSLSQIIAEEQAAEARREQQQIRLESLEFLRTLSDSVYLAERARLKREGRL